MKKEKVSLPIAYNCRIKSFSYNKDPKNPASKDIEVVTLDVLINERHWYESSFSEKSVGKKTFDQLKKFVKATQGIDPE